MTNRIEVHYDQGGGFSTCDAPGPTTKDGGAVTCPACLAALTLRAASAQGATMLGSLAASAVHKARTALNEAVRRDPLARGLLAGAAEVLRADRELRGRSETNRK